MKRWFEEGPERLQIFLRGSEKKFCLMKTMTRRQFLKAGVGLAAFASGLEMIGGCATTETPKVETLVYPSLPYNKIQPPEKGCLVGFFKEPEASLRMKDSRFIPQRSTEIEAARRAKHFDEFLEILKKGDVFERWCGMGSGHGKYLIWREILLFLSPEKGL